MNSREVSQSELGGGEEELTERLVTSLLEGAFSDTADSEALLVHRAMRAIDAPEGAKESVERVSPEPRSGRRWTTWFAAASVLLGLFLFSQIWVPSGAAWAVVEQSLASAAEEVVRHYRLRVVRGDSATGEGEANSRTIESEVYVQGADRFVLLREAMFGRGQLAIGRDRELTWVAPPRGPVRVGAEVGLGRWLRTEGELESPLLQVSGILHRLRRGYRLEMVGEEELPLAGDRSGKRMCRHVRGIARPWLGRSLPATIELWADLDSGLVMKVEANWNSSGGAGAIRRYELQLVGMPSKLGSDWFHYSTHAPNRRAIDWNQAEAD